MQWTLVPVTQGEVIQSVIIRSIRTNQMVIVRQRHDIEATVGQSDTDGPIVLSSWGGSRSTSLDHPLTDVAAAGRGR